MNAPVRSAPRVVRLSPSDNVVVSVDPIEAGAVVEGVTARARVPRGHKMATAAIPTGQPILKFEQIIGFDFLDLNICIPDDAEGIRGNNFQTGKERGKVRGDHLLEPDKIVMVGNCSILAYTTGGALDRHKARQRVRDLQARKTFVAFFIPDHDRKI